MFYPRADEDSVRIYEPLKNVDIIDMDVLDLIEIPLAKVVIILLTSTGNDIPTRHTDQIASRIVMKKVTNAQLATNAKNTIHHRGILILLLSQTISDTRTAKSVNARNDRKNLAENASIILLLELDLETCLLFPLRVGKG